MAADPIKAAMVLKTEIDKANQEYRKKLVDLKKLLKKITPKNKKVSALVLNETAIKIEKIRVQLLTDKQTIWATEAQLKQLRDQIIDHYSHLDGIHNQLLKYGNDLSSRSFN